MIDTLDSIAAQDVLPEDDLIVVADGELHPWVEDAVRQLRVPCEKRFLTHGPTRDFGNQQRNLALSWVHGTHVTFMDDDDVYAPKAFLKIRKAIVQEGPSVPLMFRELAVWGELIWRERVIERGNTITQMMVVPYTRGAMPKWPRKQGGDVDFMQAIAPADRWRWREEIICIARPQAKWWLQSRS